MSDERTTEGITREDVDEAMAYLGMSNPKPEIPIQGTLNGHLIVAVARKLQRMDRVSKPEPKDLL